MSGVHPLFLFTALKGHYLLFTVTEDLALVDVALPLRVMASPFLRIRILMQT